MTVCFVLCGLGFTSGLAQIKSQKHITAVQVGRMDSGSRVSIFSDSSLNDYEAFRRGDRFYVKLPNSDLATAQASFDGAGFQDAHVLKAGDAVIISFKLQPGANARVNERSNRLDVVISVNNSIAGNPTATPAQTTAGPVAGVVVLPNSRPRVQHSADAAGPVPPETPQNNRPRVVTPSPYERAETPALTERSHSQQATTATRGSKTSQPNSDAASRSQSNTTEPWTAAQSPSTTATPFPTTVNQPSNASTTSAYVPPRQPLAVPSPIARTEWKQRKDLVLKWIAANRTLAVVAAVLMVGLIVFGGVFLLRRRSNAARPTRHKVQGVQPKYTPDGEFDDVVEHQSESSSDLVEETTEISPATTASGLGVKEEFQHDEVFHWVEDSQDLSMNVDVPVIQQIPEIPTYVIKNEEPEREVFEL
jgi:hypothetical protein